MKLDIKAFGLTCGIIWGISLFFLTWWIIFFQGPTAGEVTILNLVYRGYTFTPWGSLVGLLWGFFDGLIGGLLFAWLYNLIAVV